MSIAIFQLIVTTSIFVSSRFGPRVLLLACITWTLFTLAFVYTYPLTALQLLTIWGSHWLYSPARPIAEKTPSFPLQTINEYATSINDHLALRQFVMHAVQPLNALIHQEQVVIESSLESAKRLLKTNKDLSQKNPEHQALHGQAYARFQTLLKANISQPSPPVLLPDFDAIARPDCQRSALALDEEISYLREERTRRLDWVRKTIQADVQLLELFEKRLRNHNATIVWEQEFCPEVRKPPGASSHHNRRKTFKQLLTELQNSSLPKD